MSRNTGEITCASQNIIITKMKCCFLLAGQYFMPEKSQYIFLLCSFLASSPFYSERYEI